MSTSATPHWLNPSTVFWDDWLLLFVQVATLVFIVIYVWKTWQMASATRAAAEASAAMATEAKEARLESLAPRIMVYFASEPTSLAEVIIENVGAGTAEDLKITFDPPLKESQGTLDVNRFFESTKTLFPPGYRVVHGFDTWPAYNSSGLPRRFDVSVSYRGKENARTYVDKHVLDADAMAHRFSFAAKGVKDIALELQRLASATDTGWRDFNAKLETSLAIASYGQQHSHSLTACLFDIVAVWEASTRIREDSQTRIDWEPLLRHLQMTALNAYRAARRTPNCQYAPSLIRLLQLAHRSVYAIDGNWQREMQAEVDLLSGRDEGDHATIDNP